METFDAKTDDDDGLKRRQRANILRIKMTRLMGNLNESDASSSSGFLHWLTHPPLTSPSLDLDPLNPRTQYHFLGYIQIISDVCPDVFQNITWHDETRQSSWRSPSQKALRIPQRDKNSKIVRFSHFAENYEVVHPTKPNLKIANWGDFAQIAMGTEGQMPYGAVKRQMNIS